MATSNPLIALREITAGYCLSRCLHIVAELGVADALHVNRRTAAELASTVNADPDALQRLLRLLSAHGVFEAHGDTFGHSPMSELLRSDHPNSMRDFVRTFGSSINWTIYGAMEHAVRSGQPAAEHVIPGGLWAYRADHPHEAALFNAAMTAKAHAQIAAVLRAYDFSSFRRIGDIGGGRGHLLRAVLDAVPSASGVLFDVAHVIAEVSQLPLSRVTFQAGDFFQDALPACDAYLLMDVIHDWDDAAATAILQAIRRAAPADATLLLIETIVPAASGPSWAAMLDVHMLVLLGGRQRTREQHAALLEHAGFTLRRVVDTDADVAILEAVAV